ncbi:12790_t:CDS:2, partial [Entrophospora sp. SA101]
MYRNLAVRTSRFGFNFCKHGSIYNLKHHKFVPTFSKTSLIRNVSNQPNDSSNGNTPPLKPVQDNNKTNSDSSNTAKEIPASTVASEETENNRQATEESHSQPSENSPTENVGELLLRSPRRKRSTTRLRSRASKPINQYKPVIPQLFLKENYLCYKDNTHSFDKMSYPLEDGIRDEIIYSARANLLPLPRSDTVPARRGHLLLNCPIEGASFYLDAVVKSVAASLQADLLTFDRQDLMELTASMFSRKGNVTPWPLFPELKGFNPYIAASPYSTTSSFSSEDEMDDDVFIEEEEGFESSPTVSRNSNFENKTLVENFQYNSTQSNGSLRTELKVIIEKVDKFFEALVSSSPTCAESTSTSSNLPSPPKIIYFRDVGDLVPTTFGSAIINSLVDAVQNQRHAGDQIMIVAGYSPSLFAMDKKSSTNSSVPSHEIQW